MNYVEFYPGDYMRDTAHLSLAEHGAYVLLLLHYYATEKPLPNDNPTLFRIARSMGEIEKEAVIKVADEFFPIDPTDGLRHSSRADRETAKARARVDSARENGKKGGRPQKPKNNPTLSDPLTQPITQTVTGSKAHHTPHAITKDIPPADAAGSAPSDPKPKAKRPPTITEWLGSLGDADAIPANDPVYAYAEKAGIPDDFLLLSWAEFKSAYTASGKRQKDFPATYRNAVKGNWYKLWWITPDGEYRLTTAGEQAKRAQA